MNKSHDDDDENDDDVWAGKRTWKVYAAVDLFEIVSFLSFSQ